MSEAGARHQVESCRWRMVVDVVTGSPMVHDPEYHIRHLTILALMVIIFMTYLCPSLIYVQSSYSFTSTGYEPGGRF